MPYVYSTATCSGTYVEYKPDNDKGHGHSVPLKQVTINGGHGVATKHLVTPKGVVTKVTDEELEFLLKNQAFQRHMKAGFMSYDNKKVEPEKKAESMNLKGDNSAPLTPADFQEGKHSDPESRMNIYKGKPKK